MALVKHNSNISKQNLGEFHSRLLAWYELHGRKHLPWRNTSDPYRILVSEIMLQQTQVETVLTRFYHPFLAKFPDLQTLADAPCESVMHAWQGLGYYRRAGFLHEAAKASAPQLPDYFEGLIALPGIGKNTAHAVLAFGYHQPYAVMEANVKRIICRISAISDPKEPELWQHAEALLNKSEPFDHNQAMMDLGSMICTVRNPKCEICPANHICIGQKAPELYPRKETKKVVPVRKRNIIVVEDEAGNIYASARISPLLGGLYQFVEVDSACDILLLNDQSYPQHMWQPVGHVIQKYSHFTLVADVFLLGYKDSHGDKNWFAKQQLHQLPWSKAERKVLELLDIAI